MMSVDTDGSAVTLQVDANTVTLQRQGTSWTSAPVQLTAGQPVRLRVTVTGLTARATLRWQAGSLPAVTLPGQACCPADLADAFAAAYRRLRAAQELMAGIGLSARELLVRSVARHRFQHAVRHTDVEDMVAIGKLLDASHEKARRGPPLLEARLGG